MPMMPPTFRPGGGAGKSEHGRKREHDRWRGSAARRGYDRDWQAVRDEVIIERGFRCEAEGCGRLGSLRKAEATEHMPLLEVDHIKSVAERPDLRLEKSNLRVLCQPCHSARTARDQGFARRGR